MDISIIKSRGMKIATVLAIAGSNLASASTFGNVTTVIEDVTEIFPAMVTLITAIVPILIIVAIIGFIIGLFDGILGGIRGKLRGL